MSGGDRPGMKMLVEPGEYVCTIEIPEPDGSTREVAAEIELVGANRPPSGSLFGKVPLKSENGAFAFPQNYFYPILCGRLRTNQQLVLLEVDVSTWFTERARFQARAVLVGFPPPNAADHFTKVRFQTMHLDRVINFAPIVATKLPQPRPGEPLEWWARERTSRYHEWSTESGVTLSVGFDARARVADPYELYVRYTPVGEIHLALGISFATVVSNWLQPLTGLMTVIAGESAVLTYVELTMSSDDGEAQRLQLFGSGIAQNPFTSSPWKGKENTPAIRVGPEGANLLQMIESWVLHVEDRSPLFETYTSLAGVSGDHPRHRFLLLLQAIEGHYGHFHIKKITADQARFTDARTHHLAVVKTSDLPSNTAKFVKKHLRSRLDPQLRDALTWAFGLAPSIATSTLSSTTLVVEMHGREGFDGTWPDALRLLRNDLSHGTRGHDPLALRELVKPLELVVRAHVLIALGVTPDVIEPMFAELTE